MWIVLEIHESQSAKLSVTQTIYVTNHTFHADINTILEHLYHVPYHIIMWWNHVHLKAIITFFLHNIHSKLLDIVWHIALPIADIGSRRQR